MDKFNIKERDMNRLYEYRKELLQKPRLKFLFLELTDKCNLACRHCGSRCSAGNERYMDTDMILKHLEEVADDFKDQNYMIVLTGGEPLLHPDFEVIVSRINALEIPWGMTSNGILIDEHMAEKLKELKMGSVSISLDGMRENHEWLRQVKGCFDITVQAIRNMHKAGIKVQVTTVVNRRNMKELEDIYLLMRELGVYSWRVVNVDPIGRALDSDNLALTDDEIVQLLEYIKGKRFDNTNPMDVCFGCSHYLSFEYEHMVRDFYFQCMAGTQVMSIMSNGDIYACLDIERRPELVQGNIRTDRISEVWYNRFREFRIDHSEICEKCRKCEERKYCGGDSFHTWNFDSNEPMICLKDAIYKNKGGK